MRQTREFNLNTPQNYYMGNDNVVISDAGDWAYILLNKTLYEPTSKLLAVKIPARDGNSPNSELAPLSPIQTKNWWFLSWSGTDDASGINHYDIQYRVGADGEWRNWMILTTSTWAIFSDAIPGETYYFRIRAIDNAGNTEAFPADYSTYTVAGDDSSGMHMIFYPFIAHE
jgi:predicted phage tail protein